MCSCALAVTVEMIMDYKVHVNIKRIFGFQVAPLTVRDDVLES